MLYYKLYILKNKSNLFNNNAAYSELIYKSLVVNGQHYYVVCAAVCWNKNWPSVPIKSTIYTNYTQIIFILICNYNPLNQILSIWFKYICILYNFCVLHTRNYLHIIYCNFQSHNFTLNCGGRLVHIITYYLLKIYIHTDVTTES